MTILGIETSCDETAAAVCRNGKILSSIVSSQGIHSEYGGVVPEVAAREHENWLTEVVGTALSNAKISMLDLDGISVTRGPGLMGALLTGACFAKGLAQGLRIPCIGINHLEAHIFSNFISFPELKYPFLCLLVSGGHTQIWHVVELKKYKLLGETRDDAAGEAFDKGARILGMGYPGGQSIEKMSEGGDEHAIPFPQAFAESDSVEFSFSGLKTSLLNYVQKTGRDTVEKHIRDVSASYQYAIIKILISKLVKAVELTGVNTAVIAGGVAANKRLRELANEMMPECEVLYPELSLCTDNGAMIAFLGEIYLKKGFVSTPHFTIIPNLKVIDSD